MCDFVTKSGLCTSFFFKLQFENFVFNLKDIISKKSLLGGEAPYNLIEKKFSLQHFSLLLVYYFKLLNF